MQARGYHAEWRLLQIALLGLGALIIYSLYREHDQIEALERDRLQAQVRVIDENLVRQLNGVNNALAGVLANSPNWDSKMSGAATVAHHLRDLSGAMPDIRTMAILDAEGTVMVANRDELTGTNFSQREYFKVPRERPDPATLYVSPPFKTVLGPYVISMGRAVIIPKGEFAGLVSAALDPEYFSVLLRSVLYAPDMRAGLMHGGGKIFLILSQDSQSLELERDLGQPGSFFSRHLESGQTSSVLTGISHASGEERMIAQRTINPAGLHMDKPLIVSVSRGLSAIYAPWRTRAFEFGGVFGVFALMASLGLYARQRRRQMFDLLVAAREEDWQEGNERLKLALGSADMGWWDWDLPSGKITFNDRWRAMLGYAFGEMEPDVSSWQKLVHPDDWPVIHAALNPHLKGETQVFEAEFRMRHKDGDWVWIHGRGRVMQRDAAGAPVRFMGTHMDITERRRQ